MTTSIQQFAQRAEAARVAASEQWRAAALRREVQAAASKFDRLVGSFQAGAHLRASKSGAQILQMCSLLAQYEQIEQELIDQYHPTPQSGVALRMIEGLKADGRRIFNADPTVREIVGQGVDVYTTARLLRRYAMADETPRVLGDKKAKKSTTVPLAIRPTRVKGTDNSPRVWAVASSTGVDLEGDIFDVKAMRQMRSFFAAGALVFMNHSYKVPADVFGRTQSAKLTSRSGRIDLDIVIRVETGNPLAMQTYEYAKAGTKLGVSVGVLVNESEKNEDGGITILDVTPLEASVVGIPANRDAWTTGAK